MYYNIITMMKKNILIIAAALSIVACNKDEEPNSVNTPVKDMTELNVSQDFNWSTSIKGKLDVNFSADTSNFVFDGEEIQIVDNSGAVIAQQIIKNNAASFYYMMPAQNVELYVYYPNTEQKIAIGNKTSIDINVPNLFNADYATILANATNSSNKKGTFGTMANLVTNGGFENNNNIQERNQGILITDKWIVKDLNNSNHYVLSNIGGSKRFQSKHNNHGYTYQFFPVTGGDLFTHTANTSGGFCTYLYFYRADYSYISQIGYAPNNQNNINSNGTIPANATYVIVYAHGDKDEWIDNITFDVAPAIPDADNDGVADNLDAYPNDVTRAYNNPFPTSGFQTLAFEDLWPFTGDYDFNDMVISNQGQFVKNGALDLVEVTLTASLDAVGSGFQNGLGVVFLDANKQPIAQNIIASVSGDATLDPSVTNGIIIFNDVYQAQSSYYQNNNVGPSKAPDTFTYTVTFNSNAGNRNLIPDTYIFRTLQRGLEVHVPGFAGTAAADAALYNTGADVNGTYKTATGLPWALELITADGKFKNPNEKVDITQAYPKFQAWAESNGTLELGWLDSFVSNITFGLL